MATPWLGSQDDVAVRRVSSEKCHFSATQGMRGAEIKFGPVGSDLFTYEPRSASLVGFYRRLLLALWFRLCYWPFSVY
jgi:hypothetical protein